MMLIIASCFGGNEYEQVIRMGSPWVALIWYQGLPWVTLIWHHGLWAARGWMRLMILKCNSQSQHCSSPPGAHGPIERSLY